jgi:hypothetical protein
MQVANALSSYPFRYPSTHRYCTQCFIHFNKVNLAQDTEQAIDSLLQFVQKNIHEDAKIVTKQAKTIHLNLPREVSIQKLFTCLHSESATSEGERIPFPSSFAFRHNLHLIPIVLTSDVVFSRSIDQSVLSLAKLP